MRQVLKPTRQQFVSGVADDRAETIIDFEPAPIRCHLGDANGGILEGRAEPRLTLRQGQLNTLAARNVPDSSNEAISLAVLSFAAKESLPLGLHPALGAIRADQSPFV